MKRICRLTLCLLALSVKLLAQSCPEPTLSYSVDANQNINLKAEGCNGLVLWYDSKPDKGEAVLLNMGNSLVVQKGNEAFSQTYYAVCEEDSCTSDYSEILVSINGINNQNLDVQIHTPTSPTAAALAKYADIT
ncbi:hypothetical protein LAG90_02440 [Marinilongibacter aquaticus]|uniref:hypothetical protein n=1 Tax=Marinilongibacter aquaticus TaxID=2975157 RepID=UPI0021BD0B54|nr:hypothetical protein [Marinilongibacter aquaticus]UBM59514.1 hypothetical protein LAG90_02440 [Marinilongibacter aquaticus]